MRSASILLSVGLTAAVAFAGGLLSADGRLLDVATGRAGVEEACLPELAHTLAAQGFAPSGIVLAERPDLWMRFRADAPFTSAFTFEDGPEQRRIDGTMTCSLTRGSARVEVATTGRPIRAG